LVLAWGHRGASLEEPEALWFAASGAMREAPTVIRYCNNAICTNHRIALTYRDDQVYSADSLAGEGLAVFNGDGDFLWGWNSDPTKSPSIIDCYAATTIEDDIIGFFPYDQFPLIVLDLLDRRITH
jgi:hypothetical protein